MSQGGTFRNVALKEVYVCEKENLSKNNKKKDLTIIDE